VSNRRIPLPGGEPNPLILELKARRIRAGLTQRDMAARLGCTQPAFSRWESGTRDPDLPTTQRWAAVVGAGLRVESLDVLGAGDMAEAYERGWEACARAVVAAARSGEPACSECGGRPKRGLVKSEDDKTWQCEGCYTDLAGRLPDHTSADGAE
jgi:transcriptional regulator with XRE-family HTH domain